MTHHTTPTLVLVAMVALVGSACSSSTASQSFPACEGPFTITEPDPTRPWTPNAITLVSEEVRDGVFAIYDQNAADHGPDGIPLATSGGFVIGDDGVLMVESMINRQLFCQAVALIQAETRKPIRYVVNTSSHGDHTFGNAFLPEDVQVVQHERTADFIAQHFEEDVAFMVGAFGDDQGIDEITPVAADIRVTDTGWSVDLGGVEVEARYYGFGQTHGDLFVYVPDAGVMWGGNAIIGEAPALPWLLDGGGTEAAATLGDVQADLPADTVVVPGHGRPITPSGMDFMLGYLRALIDEVGASVDANLSLEETRAAVTLPEYQGYALWSWIHEQVNLPAIYDELSE